MSDPTMGLLQESGWEELRKEACKIKGDLDVKLSSYAKLSSRFSHGGSAKTPVSTEQRIGGGAGSGNK
ncbi:hypothetical protein CsSME_00004225 [Camellia sinensis var. sinensis]